jgi:MOSC domain-containing protein YiiM
MPDGRLEAIWIERAHRGPMDAVQEAELDVERGPVCSVDRSRRRQVTLLEAESWARLMHELGGDIDPHARRANLLVNGVSLYETRGRVLRIGDVRLAIGGETTPCERMDDALPGLRDAMRGQWAGGAFVRMITSGVVRVGDEITWESSRKTADGEGAEDAETTNRGARGGAEVRRGCHA